MVANNKGQLLWARRVGQDSWQFPQGGIDAGESPQEALYRELHEEVGLLPEAVAIRGCTRGWLRYKLPRRFIRQGQKPLCIGQKQKWFLLQILADDAQINVASGEPPEFDHWRWVSYWYPLSQIIPFKREVYRSALKELAAAAGTITARDVS